MTQHLDLNSKSSLLSLLLELVCVELQLTESQYERATSAYDTIAHWLTAATSSVAAFDPDVYPQGSMALCTTVKPRQGEEFDVDLICELTSLSGRPPRGRLVTLVAARMQEHGTYGRNLEVRERCVRIDYAGEFHVDIVPALTAPLACLRGETAIVIPDREEEKWVPTNPRGFRDWFLSRCTLGQSTPTVFRASVEPFPKPLSSSQRASLQRVAQLFKRRRDVQFESAGDYGPKSILLTALNGMTFAGEQLLFDAVINMLDLLIRRYADHLVGEPPAVPNPSNPDENLARHWRQDRRHFTSFGKYLQEFRLGMEDLRRAEGIPQIAAVLKRLFDPTDRGFVSNAVEGYTERLQTIRQDGGVKLARGASALTTASAVGRSIPRNTFFGA